MSRLSVYRAIIWLDIVLYIYSISADTRHFGTYLYRTTCFATNSGTTEKSRYLIDNVLKMGICQQSLDDVNAGTSHIYSCEYSGTDILLTSKLYTRADCAVSHESDADGVIPEPWSDHMLSSECEGATGQQSLWRCETNPAFISSKDWLGVVLYQNTTTPEPEECSVTSIPTVYAFSEGCVALGGGGGAKYITSSGHSLTYTGYVESNCDGEAVTRENVSDHIGPKLCGNISLKPGLPFTHTLYDGYGYMSSPLNDSLFAQNDVGVGPDANPPINILAVILTLGGGFCLFCLCVCFLFYVMKKKVAKAVIDDELEKEEVRKWRKRIKGQSESDTEEESDYGESVDYTDNPLLMEKGKSESEMRDADGDGIEMMDNPMLTNPMMAQL